MEKISAVYKIVNTVTNDCYVGSSRNVYSRWIDHKCPSMWKKNPNKLLYQDFQKYGLENFQFQILAPVIPEHLKQVEQEFIELLHPTYNNYKAKGIDVKRQKETKRKYNQSENGIESNRKSVKKYSSQLCLYNGEILTLGALRIRFCRAGVEHSVLEAKKFLLANNN